MSEIDWNRLRNLIRRADTLNAGVRAASASLRELRAEKQHLEERLREFHMKGADKKRSDALDAELAGLNERISAGVIDYERRSEEWQHLAQIRSRAVDYARTLEPLPDDIERMLP